MRVPSRRPLLAGALVLGLGALLALSAGAASARGAAPAQDPAAGPATVVVVRHAEKEADSGNDPALAERGRARAMALARLLAAAGVDRLFATEYRRTRETLAPLAEASGVALETRPAGELGALAGELAALPAGSLAVVCGHSNTVPALVRALGGTAGALGEDDYDRLFVVRLGGAGCAPGTLELRYGE